MSTKTGIVNVRMVITEEKILSNIEKAHKMINPNSKKQIVQLEEDTYFKDLIESIKTYLIEYPKKKNFPNSIYKAAYGLVEYATNQFEENTKKIEELIRQREENIALAGKLKEVIEAVQIKDPNSKEKIEGIQNSFSEDIIEALNTVYKLQNKNSQNYIDSIKILNAKVNNLEANLHIEIDMERIEDRSKALSYIGIEVAEALKSIPTPLEVTNTVQEENKVVKENIIEDNEILTSAVQNRREPKKEGSNNKEEYVEQTTFEVKPSLWQKIKNSKLVQAISYVLRIKVVLDYPALPEGNSQK